MTTPCRGAEVYDCGMCRGRGRFHGKMCPKGEGRRVVIVQAGQVVKLESQISNRPRQGELRASPTTKEKRRAAGTCQRCGSPDIVNASHCEPCRIVVNENRHANNGRSAI